MLTHLSYSSGHKNEFLSSAVHHKNSFFGNAEEVRFRVGLVKDKPGIVKISVWVSV